MAKQISISRASSCAEYFSISKCTKVVNVSMEKEGKLSANVHLKNALGIVGKTKFDFSCVSIDEDRLYIGYKDYSETIAIKEGKEIVYTEEVRVNKYGEEYTVHVVDFDDEEEACAGYYDEEGVFCANETQWDGRAWKAAKDIEGTKRYTPKDCVKAFFAKFEGAIREYNNRVAEEAAAEKAAKAAAKAEKAAKKKEESQKVLNLAIEGLAAQGITLTADQMMALAAQLGAKVA